MPFTHFAHPYCCAREWHRRDHVGFADCNNISFLSRHNRIHIRHQTVPKKALPFAIYNAIRSEHRNTPTMSASNGFIWSNRIVSSLAGMRLLRDTLTRITTSIKVYTALKHMFSEKWVKKKMKQRVASGFRIHNMLATWIDQLSRCRYIGAHSKTPKAFIIEIQQPTGEIFEPFNPCATRRVRAFQIFNDAAAAVTAALPHGVSRSACCCAMRVSFFYYYFILSPAPLKFNY